jgi:ketosteroid isomerase-like protein
MRNRIILLAVFFFGFGLPSVFAQEWTPAQKEVWKNVNDYWALLAKGDMNGFFDYMHPDYVGWDNDSPVPSTKEESRKWITYRMQGMKMPLWVIKPLAIKIYGNVAFVHYYYSFIEESPDGKKKSENGRWTDILLKQDAKWVMIGDHGGSDKEED